VSEWENFFTAQVGASAALLGLLFVSISINLTRILSHATLPGRAFGALMILLMVLIVSSLLLTPGQSTALIGAEILVVGAIGWAVIARIDLGYLSGARPEYMRRAWGLIVLNQAALGLYVAAGIVTMSAGKVGLYLLVPAIIASFVKATLDAWVLMIEINR
jgi:hypothetical protein